MEASNSRTQNRDLQKNYNSSFQAEFYLKVVLNNTKDYILFSPKRLTANFKCNMHEVQQNKVYDYITTHRSLNVIIFIHAYKISL
jgi:hypothetical protein